MTLATLLPKAQRAAALPVRYKLGAGGMDPFSASPANAQGQCDCSGFVSWWLGRSRRTAHPLYVKHNGGWISTDAIVHDAKNCTGFFDQLDSARVGALIVFGGHNALRKVGHVGIVTALDAAGGASRVMHCSSGNDRRLGRAIAETGPGVFQQPDTIYAWYGGLE